jgi:hypothetical protein
MESHEQQPRRTSVMRNHPISTVSTAYLHLSHAEQCSVRHWLPCRPVKHSVRLERHHSLLRIYLPLRTTSSSIFIGASTYQSIFRYSLNEFGVLFLDRALHIIFRTCSEAVHVITRSRRCSARRFDQNDAKYALECWSRNIIRITELRHAYCQCLAPKLPAILYQPISVTLPVIDYRLIGQAITAL